MKIISASRREDMPAFHMNELMAKYHSLGEDTFWVLWTKNPRNIIGKGMDYRRTALQLTVTGLGGTNIEPNVPHYLDVFDSVEKLIKEGFNPDLINWRFDPILRNSLPLIETLGERVSKLGIHRCIVSFSTLYAHVTRRWSDCERWTLFSEDEQVKTIIDMKRKLDKYDIRVCGCAQPHLKGLIEPASCIDGEYYYIVTPFEFDNSKDKHQRKHCTCTQSTDIGKYRPCPHGCKYCYSQGMQETQDIDIEDV